MADDHMAAKPGMGADLHLPRDGAARPDAAAVADRGTARHRGQGMDQRDEARGIEAGSGDDAELAAMGAFAGYAVDKDNIGQRSSLRQGPDDGQVGEFAALIAPVIQHAGGLPRRA